jgi:hypothetical protein
MAMIFRGEIIVVSMEDTQYHQSRQGEAVEDPGQ